jgi:hypothetical protein
MHALSNLRIALLSADEFEGARAFIPELAQYRDYEDWLDHREGRFMGYSLGGAGAELFVVGLQGFLTWCCKHKIPPTESALDAFAWQSEKRSKDVHAAA